MGKVHDFVLILILRERNEMIKKIFLAKTDLTVRNQ